MTSEASAAVGLANRPLPTLFATSLSITLGALPIFLVGAMAVFIRPELGFGESALGALATIYYLTSALTTFPAGRLAERLGGPMAMAVAATLSSIVFLGICTVCAVLGSRWRPSWWWPVWPTGLPSRLPIWRSPVASRRADKASATP